MAKNLKTALIKTLNGEFSVEFANSRDFINGIRSAIERKTLYEFSLGNTRTLINANNIVSMEMEAEALGNIGGPEYKGHVPKSEAEIREDQLAMQPDILKFEAKAAAMTKMKEKEDAQKKLAIENIYGK
jgi:hypothetical protein